MQASYSVRRSPVSSIAALLVVLAALFLGATGGYLVKGLDHQASSRPAVTIIAPAPFAQDARVPASQSTRQLKNTD
jgi:hypothetical protein